jgi:hypothetical protein
LQKNAETRDWRGFQRFLFILKKVQNILITLLINTPIGALPKK